MFKKNKKRKIILIILLLVLVISGFLFYFLNIKSSSKKTTATSITYNASDYNDDFSDCEEVVVNLDDVDSKYTITKRGVYRLTGSLNGYIEVNTSSNVKIILDNATITNSTGPAIYVKDGKDTYIELVGESTLTDASSYSGFSDTINSCIYSSDDLVIQGDGTLNINAKYQDGITSKDNVVIKSGNINIESNDDGIRGKDAVIIMNGNITINSKGDGIKSTNSTDSSKGYILIQNGTFNITSTNDAIDAYTNLEIDDGNFTITTGGGSSNASTKSSWGNWGSNSSSDTASSKGLKAKGSILIKNINATLDTSDDAIHSNSVVNIKNGSINISSGDDGIHADSTITIDNGTINITKSYEGIEANYVTINDGTISVVASDDGININGGNDDSAGGGRPGANNYSNTSSDEDVLLTINGGTITVNSDGDGLDSNGSIIMNGGTVYVDGPTNSGNGALDYNNTFTMNGGTIIAIGSSGMAQNISQSSSQNGVLINLSNSYSAGTTIEIGDIKYTSLKSFNSILISSSSLKTGESYNVKLNGQTVTSFTISSVTTNVGNTSGGMGGNPGRR